jgi:hypothetical protein
MVNNSMGKTKNDAGCDWVRARLPLWVGDREVRTDGNGEGGDLSLLEHQRMERHLEHCATCCCHRADLERALETLAAAAADLPVEPQAPSLWPALKHRIQDHHQPVPSRWIRMARAFTGLWGRGLTDFTTDQPVRRAWAHDSLQAIFTSRENRRLGSNQRLGLVLGLGLIASLLIAVTTVPGLWHEWANAQSTIMMNASPLVDRGASPGDRTIELQPEPSRSDDSETQDELAQADIARPVEPTGGGVTSSTEPKPAAPARFGYDLEHGIPMPPDARESKPVY